MTIAYRPTALPTRRRNTQPTTGLVELIGVPMDLGASRRGVDMGPSAMRLSSLTPMLERLGLTVHDNGNIAVPDRTAIGSTIAARLEAIREVCAELAARTAGAVRSGARPLVIGLRSSFPA